MSVVEVAAGVWRTGSRYVNWYIVDAGADGLTVVDTGLPGYRDQLPRAHARLGREPADVKAVLLTHGHIDHVGAAGAAASMGATLYLHPADAALAATPRANRTERSIIPYLAWPATAAFVLHCLRQGALRPPRMPQTQPLLQGQVDGIPGTPVVTHTPGHTDGSCTLEFREHGVVFVGDLLCTVDPRTARSAPPQLQTRASNRNSNQALASLDKLHDVRARLVLPGHGRPWQDGVEAAVASARQVGCR